MASKKFIFPFVYLVLIYLFANFSLRAQDYPGDENKPMIDTIEQKENLLDSNEVYKKQFDSLSKEGDWMKVDKSDLIRDLSEETGEDLEYYSYGGYIYAWRPYCADPYWNPYFNGSWVFSSYGWMWLSNYNWGWGPYNYGRWFCSSLYGWMWLPGSLWAPNWVTWRYHGSYVGWYPTCPSLYWYNGNQYCTNRLFAYAPADWLFVKKNDFTKKIDKNIIVKSTSNGQILKQSDKIRPTVYVDPRMPKFKYNGPNVDDISNATGEKITPKDVVVNAVKGQQTADDKVVSTYGKAGTVPLDENIPKRYKGGDSGTNDVKIDNTKTTTTGDKNPPDSSTKKTRTKGPTNKGKSSDKGYKGYEGSNDKNNKTTKSTRDSNSNRKVERSNGNNDSDSGKSTRGSK